MKSQILIKYFFVNRIAQGGAVLITLFLSILQLIDKDLSFHFIDCSDFGE